MSPMVRRRRRGNRLQRFGRTFRLTSRRRLPLVGAGVLAIVALWCVWTVVSATHDLHEVDRQAQIMRAALIRGDADGVRQAADRFQSAADEAESRTAGLTWSVFELVPIIGDDAEGIATVAHVIADIGRDGVPPIVKAADLVQAESFRPSDGIFPVAQIEGMAEPAGRSEAAFNDAARTLEKVDSSRFIAPIQRRFLELQSLVIDARATLGSTYRAAKIIPRMMATDRARYYLMVLQNNAELRSGGGLPGALSLVRMKDGRADVVEQTDMSDLGHSPVPVVQLTAQERRVFGQILGLAAVDATLTPDFVRSAEIVRARWESEIGGRIDGIFFVDPVAVSYLLRGTGAVAVKGYPPVDAQTIVGAVENEIYLRSADRKVQSDYQQAVAEAVFDALAGGRGDTTESIRGLVAGVMEGRIRMHSFEPETQAEIEGTAIAGEFSDQADDQPQVGIYINDAGPTKMQYYLRYTASLFARSCADGKSQVIAGSMNLHSDTPADLAKLTPAVTGEGFPHQRVKPGDQLLVIYLTAPVGGSILEVAVDGQAISSDTVRYKGRELNRFAITLDPQQRRELNFVMESGVGQTGDPALRVTPGAFPGSPNGNVRSACDVR